MFSFDEAIPFMDVVLIRTDGTEVFGWVGPQQYCAFKEVRVHDQPPVSFHCHSEPSSNFQGWRYVTDAEQEQYHFACPTDPSIQF